MGRSWSKKEGQGKHEADVAADPHATLFQSLKKDFIKKTEFTQNLLQRAEELGVTVRRGEPKWNKKRRFRFAAEQSDKLVNRKKKK